MLRKIIERVQMADINGNPQTILARTSFITNLIRVSEVMSDFKLATGYMPSIPEITRHIVSGELLQSKIERESVRPLERILKSKAPQKIDSAHLKTGTKVLVYHKISNSNEPNEWIYAYVVK